MILKCDAISHCDPKTVYGSAGEEVEIVGSYITVMIVENKAGNRFPVRADHLSTEEIVLEPKQIIINPVQVAARPPKAKPAPINHPTLF